MTKSPIFSGATASLAAVLVAFALLVPMLTISEADAAAQPNNGPCAGGEIHDGVCTIDFGPPTCPAGSEPTPPENGTWCVAFSAPTIQVVCPEGSQGTIDNCYFTVPKVHDGTIHCAQGVPAGELCVLVGAAPVVDRDGNHLCESGFGYVDGKCLQYSAGYTKLECPVGSVEDAAGFCRESVSAIKLLKCGGAAYLIDEACATHPDRVCTEGVFQLWRCVKVLPGHYCDGQLVTLYLEEGGDGTGTPGDDVIWGTDGPDIIVALSGNDVICARGGDDVIIGMGGKNRLFGDRGDDLIMGGPGDELLDGGEGNDDLRGGRGDDEVRGGYGNDYVDGYLGSDVCDGGPGEDRASDYCEKLISVP